MHSDQNKLTVRPGRPICRHQFVSDDLPGLLTFAVPSCLVRNLHFPKRICVNLRPSADEPVARDEPRTEGESEKRRSQPGIEVWPSGWRATTSPREPARKEGLTPESYPHRTAPRASQASGLPVRNRSLRLPARPRHGDRWRCQPPPGPPQRSEGHGPAGWTARPPGWSG